MKQLRFTEDQMEYALRLADGGVPIAEMCHWPGVLGVVLFAWKNACADFGVIELRKLEQLDYESSRLRYIVVDLPLDKRILQGVVILPCPPV